jgi:hypothetical protein
MADPSDAQAIRLQLHRLDVLNDTLQIQSACLIMLDMKRGDAALLQSYLRDVAIEGKFGRVAIEIKHTSTVGGRDPRALRDFVAEHKTRLGVVVNNDVLARRYEEGLIGLPFTWL